MRKLTFPIDDRLKQIVAHAAAHEPAPYYGRKIGRSLYFVKDQGAYLMSAGSPGLIDPDGKTSTSQLVQYAKGHNPNLPDYDYDHTRSVCGGDDFGEPIEVEFFENAIARGATTITIGITDNNFKLSAE